MFYAKDMLYSGSEILSIQGQDLSMSRCMEHKVERAIILAAGLGSRMLPVTKDIPKPLVEVQGKRIVDTLLDALLEAGIADIYLVRGYQSEKFDVLLKKYPNLKFIENPEYQISNNISSIVQAGERVENAYILEGDLLLKNPALITATQQQSNYLAFPVAVTEDWCFYTNTDGCIKQMAVGGRQCMQMVGISYWTPTDGKRLAEHAVRLFSHPEKRQYYWDQIALEEYISEYDIYVRPCQATDVIEIDTLAELQALDERYQKCTQEAGL